tara:strand:+ start:236 stop:466 length:231 start_codon:yes stop_codon:yes gene_type:complete
MNNHLYITAKLKYEAEAYEAKTMLDMLFNKTVMVGEHTDILKEIDKWARILAEALDASDALDKYLEFKKEEGIETP